MSKAILFIHFGKFKKLPILLLVRGRLYLLIDFLQLLGVKEKKKILYEYFAIQMAQRSIEKGGLLETNESRPIMQQYCAMCTSQKYETEISGKYY